MHLIIGVLALQGAFAEHLTLLHHAAAELSSHPVSPTFTFTLVRTPVDLHPCTALIIPGGESTSISLIASSTGLLEPLRDFVKVQRKPVWGTCAGLILLAEQANRTKVTGQELIGGLDVRVQRNFFGRQVESFESDLELTFLGVGDGLGEGRPFPGVFIRAPVVEEVLSAHATEGLIREGTSDGEIVAAPAKKATSAVVEVLGRLPGRASGLRQGVDAAKGLSDEGDIVVVRQGNVFGTAFHPELTRDARIHIWWLKEIVRAVSLNS